MLRVSGEATDTEVDLEAVTAGSKTSTENSQIPHSELLIALAEAVVAADESELELLRARAALEMGEEQLVDAVAVAGNFMRMVRIADGTGIPLDKPMMQMSQDFRSDIGIDKFAGANNTPELGVIAKATSGLARMATRRMAKS